jgi:hypothetical protein
MMAGTHGNRYWPGTQGGKAAQSAGDVNARQREALALEMRLHGASLAEIAAACGYLSNGRPNESAASKAYYRALARIPEAAANQTRHLISERLDEIISKLYSGEMTPDVARALLLTDKARRELFALDEPPNAAAVAGPLVVEIPAALAAALRGEPVLPAQIEEAGHGEPDGE